MYNGRPKSVTIHVGAVRPWVAWVALLVACGSKSPPEAAGAAPAPAPAPAPAAPEPEPEPEPAAAETPPSARPHNADFSAVLTMADGSSVKGHVVRVERTVDWYGDQGWSDEDKHLSVTLEGNGTEIESPWANITSVTIAYGSTTDVDCSYDSSFDPAMYSCILRTTTKVKTKDGKSWDAADPHKWMFVFESGETVEFHVFKLPARRQEEAVPELGTVSENTKLYEELQAELEKARVGKVPKSIAITAP